MQPEGKTEQRTAGTIPHAGDAVPAAFLTAPFLAILAAITRFGGFVLIPVDVPATEFASALGRWLETTGRTVHTIEPRTEDDWHTLAPAMLKLAAGPGDVVMVIGSSGLPAGMEWGLGLLNQKRDLLAKHLPCPLLWCGPEDFLNATWSFAPDFWSIRDIGFQIELPPQEDTQDAKRRLWLEQARQSGNGLEIGRAALSMAQIHFDRGLLDDAEGFARQALSAYAATGEIGELGIARVKLLLGQVASLRGRIDAAEQAARDALGAFEQLQDKGGGMRAHSLLAEMALQRKCSEEALPHYDEALVLARQLGNLDAQARLLSARSTVRHRLGDIAGARADADLVKMLGASIPIPQGEILHGRGALSLDRDRECALAFKHIRELVSVQERRVEAMIAYGAPGNLLGAIGQQILDYVEMEATDPTHVLRIGVEFPAPQRVPLDAVLFEQTLKAQLNHAPSDHLSLVLHSKMPRSSHAAARILCLNWRVLRDRQRYDDLVLPWLEFLRDRVAPACPPDGHVLALLPIEAEGAVLTKLESWLPGLQAGLEFRTNAFRCTVLDPLGPVTLVDVVDFLDGRGASHFHIERLATAIFKRTEGHYEQTVELLRRGLEIGWGPLSGELGLPSRPTS